jgi:hypothetical protein
MMSYRNNKNGCQPFLSQNNFNDWLKNPDLVRRWHHDRKNMPKHSPEELKFLDFGHQMHRKAHDLYPDGFEETRKLSYEGHLENSMKLIRERRIPLFELGFRYDNLYARPDMMVPVKSDSWDMIEVKSTSHVYENDIKYVAYLYYVIVKCGVKINKCYLMHLKKGLYAHPEMSAKDIFEKTDVTEKVIALQEFIINDAIVSMRDSLKTGNIRKGNINE